MLLPLMPFSPLCRTRSRAALITLGPHGTWHGAPHRVVLSGTHPYPCNYSLKRPIITITNARAAFGKHRNSPDVAPSNCAWIQPCFFPNVLLDSSQAESSNYFDYYKVVAERSPHATAAMGLPSTDLIWNVCGHRKAAPRLNDGPNATCNSDHGQLSSAMMTSSAVSAITKSVSAVASCLRARSVSETDATISMRPSSVGGNFHAMSGVAPSPSSRSRSTPSSRIGSIRNSCALWAAVTKRLRSTVRGRGSLMRCWARRRSCLPPR